jgi:hypothetical protein
MPFPSLISMDGFESHWVVARGMGMTPGMPQDPGICSLAWYGLLVCLGELLKQHILMWAGSRQRVSLARELKMIFLVPEDSYVYIHLYGKYLYTSITFYLYIYSLYIF